MQHGHYVAVKHPLQSRYAALLKAPEIPRTAEIPKRKPDPHGITADPQTTCEVSR